MTCRSHFISLRLFSLCKVGLIKPNIYGFEMIRTWELVGFEEIMEINICIVFIRFLTGQLCL